ncbi:hypothetical protein B0H21DRAFT_775755 [Amylocystis lapponica]|nr:hypothetical protein B0H21DRAFT_775755 [Amylocystis lapponica]
MPTCLLHSRGPPLPLSAQARSIIISVKRYSYGIPATKTRRRALSTAAAAAVKKPQVPDHRQTLTRHAVVCEESVEFWNDLLARAYDDLCPSPAARSDKVRIVVYGCDELSGSQALVTALLQDPFVSESQKECLRQRWKAAPENHDSITLQDGVPAAEDSGIVNVQSAWFQRFGAPLKSALKSILHADIPIIVCNPASTPLSSILSSDDSLSLPFVHPHAILVVTSASYSEALAERIKSFSGSDLVPLFIDPGRALAALDTLSAAPSFTTAVQKYQDDFAGSNISALTEAISQTISSHGPSAVVAALHTRTAQSLLYGSLNACREVLTRAGADADVVSANISALRSQMEEAKARAGKDVFGIAGLRPDEGDEIQRAVATSRRDIQAVMDALVWWKLPWKVDDLLDRAWCTDLEHKLMFHAGRLASFQQSFTESGRVLLARSQPPSPFHSPLAAAPAYPLTFPTARLHTTAQRAVLGMGSSVFGGLGVAWAGWAGQLGLLDIGMQAETVVGVVGRFERAKRRWWQDCNRVGDGLERDLRATLDRTMGERVIVVSEKACSGLEELVTKQRDEIAELRDEVTALVDELDSTVP